MTDLRRFPGAPVDSELTEQGWLVVFDEAYTESEWRILTQMQRRAITGDVPLWDDGPDETKLRRKRLRDKETKRLRKVAA